MKKLLYKEIKLAASPLSFLFIAFSLLSFMPRYPILCGAFFITLGLFYSFQVWRESDDITYSVLLPIKKSDVVKAKYLFVVFIELCGIIIMTIITIIRMTVLKDVEVYADNALMNATPYFITFSFTVFALFNFVFVNGFFATAYKFGKPFIIYAITVFLLIGVGETLIHIPGLEFLNKPDGGNMIIQMIILCAGTIVYIALTYMAYCISKKQFEKIDL